jgi:hypothetical protein
MAQNLVDPYLLARRQRHADAGVSTLGCSPYTGTFSVSALTPGAWCTSDSTELELQWVARLRQRADRIVAGRFELFDREDQFLGNPVDWNKDHKHGIETPRGYSARIDYRDFRVAGDAKLVWEPNRHHALVLLGRAYRATGAQVYAHCVVTLLEQWLDQCPYGHGMNWRFPLELAVRLINWVWALDLIRPAGVVTPDVQRRLLTSVSLHLLDITRKYSRGTSANNHRIGEAAGVFIASAYFGNLPQCTAWREQSFRILAEEIERQTFADGGNREQALGYHVFVLQFFALAGVVARAVGQDFDERYWDGLRGMFRFLAAFCEAGSPPPMFGDSDDGYVLDLDADPCDPVPWLALGSQLFDDGELAALAPAAVESLTWLPLGNCRSDARSRPRPTCSTLRGHAFPDSGYYLLQHGRREHSERISAVFDCGPLGFTAIAAHGHADALSFTLRAAGTDVFVDPGTYDYFTHPQWRKYFRSTRAHNTVLVDAVDQSVMLGPFMWGQRARARCLKWRATNDGGCVAGEHDGYTRLADPVIHRRTLELRGTQRTLIVADDLIARGRHSYTQFFHLAARARITSQQTNRLEVDFGTVRATLTFDPQLHLTALHGSESPLAGWVSVGYHRIAPCVTLVGHCAHQGALQLRTQIVISEPVDAATG